MSDSLFKDILKRINSGEMVSSVWYCISKEQFRVLSAAIDKQIKNHPERAQVWSLYRYTWKQAAR